MLFDSDVWVIIAAFNEEQAIQQVLDGFKEYPYSIVVVDDCSSDDTAQCALSYPVIVLRHSINLGQGAALQTGIKFALQSTQTRHIVTFDADGQHEPSDIPRMIEICKTGGYDMVLGSRFLSDAKTMNMPWLRRQVLKLAILFTRVTSGLNITDTHNGLRVFTVQAARQIEITQNRMAHASEILAEIKQKKLRYCEAPVTIHYTRYSLRKGQSIWNSLGILWEMIEERMR